MATTSRLGQDELYGVLEKPNIRRVCFGKYAFDTWYGNAAYFAVDHSTLGLRKHALLSSSGTVPPHSKSHTHASAVASNTSTAAQLPIHHTTPHKNTLNITSHSTAHSNCTIKTEPIASEGSVSEYWLDTLYVCEFCFKYTDAEVEVNLHTVLCPFNKFLPPVGKLMYKDVEAAYIITQVKGFQHELFAQNLCLFGKLFLDNKSVYYNVDQFDFYLVYGKDDNKFKPMGFFSKEVTAWDNENNLACICVFPPFQRKGLGSLLIEFLYELAAVTPGQRFSGPEFPLSKFGKLSYYNFWSRKLCVLLDKSIVKDKTKAVFNLAEIAEVTGFRKEDILITLNYMEVLLLRLGEQPLIENTDTRVYFSVPKFQRWCSQHRIDVQKERRMLHRDYLVI